MIIKSVNLETVCGITSKLPENEFSEFEIWQNTLSTTDLHLRENQM